VVALEVILSLFRFTTCPLLENGEHSWAFDGERRGFILGLGLGLGQTSFGGYEGKRTSYNADFKIGHGFSNTTQIYWAAKSSFLSRDRVTSNHPPKTESDTWLSGVGSIGISHFFKAHAPCLYITGGIGYSTWAPFSGDDTDAAADMGIGFFSGVGYEFAKHWSAEINIMAGSPSRDESTISTWTIKASINALAY